MNRDTRLSGVLHVLLHLAQANRPLTSEELAKSMGTNPAVFRRTMAGLRNAGYVSSEKGHGGGWQLTRPLDAITLLDVYQSLGSPNLFATANRNETTDCKLENAVNSALSGALADAEQIIMQRFAEVTLEQLMKRLYL